MEDITRIQHKLETDEGVVNQQVGLRGDLLELLRKNQGSYRNAPGTPCCLKQGNSVVSSFEVARDSFSVDSSPASRTSATVQRARPAFRHLQLYQAVTPAGHRSSPDVAKQNPQPLGAKPSSIVPLDSVCSQPRPEQ